MFKYLLAIFVIIASQGCVSKIPVEQSVTLANYDNVTKSINQIVKQKMRTNNIQGMSVAIVDRDKILHLGHYGYADVNKNKSINLETSFRIGSITKVFTATAIMQLQEQGLLDIDDSIGTYLPDFYIKTDAPKDLNRITLRSLLTHASGLPTDHLAGFSSYEANAILLESLAGDYLSTSPFTVWSYSNVAYNLLGRVIENVSGVTYQQYITENILGPLDMHSAILGFSESLSKSYSNGIELEFEELRDQPAGDLSMTSKDLAKFAISVLNENKTVLKRESFSSMTMAQNEKLLFENAFNMGIGWILGFPSGPAKNDQDFYWHDGSIGGFHSMLLVNPSNGIAVAILANTVGSGDVVKQIAEEAIIETNKIRTIPSKHVATIEHQSDLYTVPFTKQHQDSLPGNYVSNHYGDIHIYKKGKHLYAKADSIRAKLEAYEDGSFGPQYRLFNLITIKTDSTERIQLFQEYYNGSTLLIQKDLGVIAEKIDEIELSDIWEARLGQYKFLKNGNIEFKNTSLSQHKSMLIFKGDVIVDGNKSQFGLYLKPRSDERATIIGYGRSLGESLVFKNNESFTYSGFEFRKALD